MIYKHINLAANQSSRPRSTLGDRLHKNPRRTNKSILNLSLADGEGNEEVFGVTPEHPFWVNGKGWVDAKDLQVDNEVATFEGKILSVKSIIPDTERHTTYNFEVADYHTYFVGKQGAWVHNQCLPEIKKVVNTNLPHAIKRAVERAVFTDVEVASRELKNLSSQISKNGFPKGSIIDPAHADRVLVPVGNKGMISY